MDYNFLYQVDPCLDVVTVNNLHYYTSYGTRFVNPTLSDVWGYQTQANANFNSGLRDPLFVNPLANNLGNFHLQSDSSAISAGIAIVGYTTDYDGNTVNSPPDIGAFRYLSSSSSVLKNYLRSSGFYLKSKGFPLKISQ